MSDEVGVSVDKDFARFGSKAYAINKINSVDVIYSHPYSRNAGLAWGLVAVLCVVVFFNGEGGTSSSPVILLLIAAFCGFMSWRAIGRAKIVEYQLMLATSSGSVQAIKSQDRDFILDTRSRLERAIAGTLE